MRININSNDIHEILKLSKANNISFMNINDVIYVMAHDQEDVTFKNQIVKKICAPGESGVTLINKDVLKLIPKNTEVTITSSVILAGKRKIKYAANKLIDDVIEVEDHLTTIPAGELKHLLNVDYAIAKDETRPVLNGICINNGEFAALDGFRLATRKGKFEAKEQVIISADLIPILKKIKYDGEVNIYYNDRYVKFQFGDLEVIGNRIEGEYIKYKTIIPEDYNTSITLETKPILDILKDYKKNKFELVKLNFKEDNMSISANNETATIEDNLCINLQGESLEIAFNINYLIDAFKNYETAILELSSRVSPMVVKSTDKLDLVLPVRIIR